METTQKQPTSNVNDTSDDIALAKELHLPASLARLLGWKYLDINQLGEWLAEKVPSEKQYRKEGLFSAPTLYRHICTICRGVNLRSNQFRAWHVLNHLSTIETYGGMLPRGVMLKIKEALELGYNRHHFYICDPFLVNRGAGDPMPLYALNPTENHPGGQFFCLMEWDMVQEA